MNAVPLSEVDEEDRSFKQSGGYSIYSKFKKTLLLLMFSGDYITLFFRQLAHLTSIKAKHSAAYFKHH
jgi:hypothetical protein